MALPPGWKNILVTDEQFQQFVKAHAEALKTVGRDGTFEFLGETYVVGYAGYVIEYLQNQSNVKDSSNVRRSKP